MQAAVIALKILSMILGHFFERDKEKRAKKKELLGEIKNAKTIKDKKQRASRLNSIVDKSRRL